MSRATSKPTDKDHSKAIRMAEYSGDPSNQKAIQEFRFDTLEPTVVEHTNSDWAGCRSSGEEHVVQTLGHRALELHATIGSTRVSRGH